MKRPCQFEPLVTKKSHKDGMLDIPVFEYIEKNSPTRPFALMEATVHGDRGTIRVRLQDGIHYVFESDNLVIKIDSRSFKDIFKGALSHFDVAYVGEETHSAHLQSIKKYGS